MRSLLALVCAVCAAFIAFNANAGEYPERPIKLVVPLGAGGAGDVASRVLAESMGHILGKTIVVENQPGAGGIAAARTVLNASPDGYTTLMIGNIYAIGQSMLAHVPYDLVKDFEPISVIGKTDVVIFVAKSSPLNSIKDLIDQAKRAPGTINLGVGLFGTTQHLTGELFKSKTGIDATVVPFSATSQLQTAVRGGDVNVGFELLAPVLGALQSGDLKALAVAGSKRSSFLPNTPTLTESGISVDVASWALLAVRSGTPAPIVASLNKAMVAALASPALQQKFSAVSLEPVGGSADEARQMLVAEIAKWKHAIEVAKITPQ